MEWVASAGALVFDDVEAWPCSCSLSLRHTSFRRWPEIVTSDRVNSSDLPAASHPHATPRRARDNNRTSFAAEDRSSLFAGV